MPQGWGIGFVHGDGLTIQCTGGLTPIVLFHNVLRGLREPSQFHGNDMSVDDVFENENQSFNKLFANSFSDLLDSLSFSATGCAK